MAGSARIRSVRCVRRDAADHPHRRALPRAVRAEEAERLARADVEVDPVDRDEVAEALDEAAWIMEPFSPRAHATCLHRPHRLSRRLDVPRDLVDQVLLAREDLLVTEPLHSSTTSRRP